MKLSRTAIKELTAAYRAVLKHALVVAFGGVIIMPAVAGTVPDVVGNPEIADYKASALVISGLLAHQNTVMDGFNVGKIEIHNGTDIYDKVENTDKQIGARDVLNFDNDAKTQYLALYDVQMPTGVLGLANMLNFNVPEKIASGFLVAGNDGFTADGVYWNMIDSLLQSNGGEKIDGKYAGSGTDGSVYRNVTDGLFNMISADDYAMLTTNNSIIDNVLNVIFEDAERNPDGTYNDTNMRNTLDAFIAATFNKMADWNLGSGVNNLSDDEKAFAQWLGEMLGDNNGGPAIVDALNQNKPLQVNVDTFEMDGGKLEIKNGATVSAKTINVTGGDITVDNSNVVIIAGADDASSVTGTKLVFEDGSELTNNGTLAFIGDATHTITFDESRFFNNGTANLTNVDFSDLEYAGDEGSAIYNRGKLTVTDSAFVDNTSTYSGAMENAVGSELTLTDSMFVGNRALSTGALGVFGQGQISNTTFTNNVATDADDDGAGAVFFGAESQSTVTDSTFQNNKSASMGGAIATRNALANNSAATLDITDGSVFMDNFAETNGGAIYNTFYHSDANADAVTISDTQFIANVARNGGAIYNDGTTDKAGNSAAMRLENVTFANNVAKSMGGAIYNSLAAKLELSGENIFVGNRYGSFGNDIYNDGNVTITDGVTTIDGGIIGNNGVLTVADGATLNIGSAMVWQSKININGVVNVDVFDVRRYGRLYGQIAFGDNAQLNLTVATAGTYEIFGSDNDFAGINAGPLFDVENKGAAGVVISTKAADKIASENGLSGQAATVLTAITNAGGAVVGASIVAQNALASGNTDYIEAESAKVAPVNKPVVHSVSTSVQNQVLSLVAARMSGGVIGRSGGDFVTTGSGMWAHGLINRSKMNDAFHGDTRGAAFGIDAIFNHKYTFGMGYAHGDTDVHAGAQKTDIDSDTLFAYAQYKPNKWFMNGAFSYTFADYTDSADLFGFNISSTHNVDSYGAQLLTGYDFASGVTPSAGVRYLHIAQDAYSNGLVNIKASDTDFVTGVAGLKYAFDIEATRALTLKPELRAAATYDFISDDATATVLVPGAASYAVNSDRLSRFGSEFGIGMSMLYRGFTVSLNYDLDLHKDYTSQTGMLKFRYNF